MDIYYIGGSPCSGKSTIAEMLTSEYGFAYYKADDFLDKHMQQAAEEGKLHSATTLKMSNNQMWMRDPQLQKEEEIAIYKEIFQYALDDIKNIRHTKVIAEAAGFMPQLMAKEGISHNRYICIVPTESFQRKKYAERPWINVFLQGCEEPDIAFDNWMSRDVLFAQEMLRKAKEHGYEYFVTDGNCGIEETYGMVVKTFALSPY